MSEQRLRLAPAWISTRVDELETFEITDLNEQVVALVPMGANAPQINRQRAVLSLVTAAPVLQSAVNAVLSELLEDKPNYERCRSLLIDAAAAARGS